MNFIHRLQAENDALRRKLTEASVRAVAMRAMLQGAKFQGMESTCGNCNQPALEGRCQHCGADTKVVGINKHRKDWISTGDVDAWLVELIDQLMAD